MSNVNFDGDNIDLLFFLKKENVIWEGLCYKKFLNFVLIKKYIKLSIFNLNVVFYF